MCLKFGVPQGYVIGPKKNSMYTKPIGDRIMNHNLDVHLYADDTQIYVAFKPNQSRTEALSLMSVLQMCGSE